MTTYEEILQYINGLNGNQISYDDLNIDNPNLVTPIASLRAPQINYGAIPELQQYHRYDQANNADSYDPAVIDWLKTNGYKLMRGEDTGGEAFAQWLQGPDGKNIAESALLTGTNDDKFKLAALAAMAVTGANIYGAGMGAGGGAQGLMSSTPEALGELGGYGYTGGAADGATLLSGGGAAATTPAAVGTTAASTAAGVTPAVKAAGSGLLSSLLPESLKGISPFLQGAATLYGAYEGSQEQPGESTTQARTLDPRIDSRVFGEGGLMSNVDDWYNKNKSGQNQQMIDAQTWLRGLLSSPETTAGIKNQYGTSQGLMSLFKLPGT